MRVLHLFSDYRWTGPAEPVVQLVQGLKQRGVDVTYACRRHPDGTDGLVAIRAAEHGLDPVTRFALDRYCPPIGTCKDLTTLPAFIREGRFDLIHTHLSHDHAIGGLAARIARRGLVIRTNHKGVPLPGGVARWVMLRSFTDAYLGFSHEAAKKDAAAFGIPAQRVCITTPAVDLQRFDRANVRKDVRPELGLGKEHIVGGIVARVQRHRRFEVLLEALKKVQPLVPQLRFLIIGRGTHIEKVAREPVRQLGLQEMVLFPGYRGEDYVDFINCLDFKVFLMPGSDGTCRAVRELMAMGKPVIAARRGMLPELVEHGQTGLVVDDTPGNLADAIVALAKDAQLRQRLGDEAARVAHERFQLERQVEATLGFYEQLLRETSRVGV